MSRLVRLLHELGVSPPLVAEPQTDLVAAPGGHVAVEKIFGHVETLGKLRHIPLRKISGVGRGEWGVGSGEWGVSNFFDLIPHSPLPTMSNALFLPSRSSHRD